MEQIKNIQNEIQVLKVQNLTFLKFLSMIRKEQRLSFFIKDNIIGYENMFRDKTAEECYRKNGYFNYNVDSFFAHDNIIYVFTSKE